MKFRYEKIIELECDGTLIDAIIVTIKKHSIIGNSELLNELEHFIEKDKIKSMILNLVELGIVEFGPHLKLVLNSNYNLDIIKNNYPHLLEIKINHPWQIFLLW